MTDKLKNIAMQWVVISHSELKANYNNFKIVDLKDLEKLLKISFQKNEILIMATRKNKKPDQPPSWFTSYMDGFKKWVVDYYNNPPQPPKWFRDFAKKQQEFNNWVVVTLNDFKKEVRDALTKLSARVDNLVVKNHLIE